jgi:hypothetical protein
MNPPTESACRTRGCGKAIPIRQSFCRNCLSKLPSEIRHALLFASAEIRLEALNRADKILSGVSESIRPGSAKERFRAARDHAAAAMRTLERKR